MRLPRMDRVVFCCVSPPAENSLPQTRHRVASSRIRVPQVGQSFVVGVFSVVIGFYFCVRELHQNILLWRLPRCNERLGFDRVQMQRGLYQPFSWQANRPGAHNLRILRWYTGWDEGLQHLYSHPVLPETLQLLRL